METKESVTLAAAPKQEWLKQIDDIVENGYSDKTVDPIPNPRLDHDYEIAYSSEFVISYVSGYIVRSVKRFSECESCVDFITSKNPSEKDKYTQILSYGYLIYPSENLFNLIQHLEKIVLTIVGNGAITIDTMTDIANELGNTKIPVLVGCAEHKKLLTKTIVNNFLVMRGHFLAKSFNRLNSERKTRSRKLRKDSKLI